MVGRSVPVSDAIPTQLYHAQSCHRVYNRSIQRSNLPLVDVASARTDFEFDQS